MRELPLELMRRKGLAPPRGNFGTSRFLHRYLPPHPGPLPWGEGESKPDCLTNPNVGKTRCTSSSQTTAINSSLSPRERAGVRGNKSCANPAWATVRHFARGLGIVCTLCLFLSLFTLSA